MQLQDDEVTHAPLPSPPTPLHRYCDVLPAPLFKSLQHCQHQPNSEQQSYWIPLTHSSAPASTISVPSSPTAHHTLLADLSPNSPPSLLVEQVVQHLFHHVLRPALPATSSPVGLEWWLHSRPASSSMFLHFDRDEWRWQQKREAAFPLLSSVTFLTNNGGPTFIVQQTTDSKMSRLYPERTGGLPRDEHKDAVKVEQPHTYSQQTAPLHGSLVWPMGNTTVTFPGNFLHGVLGVQHDDRSDVFMMKDEQKDGSSMELAAEQPRVTLMINVWEEPLQNPTCITLREATSVYLQHRYGKVLSEADIVSSLSEPFVAPRRVELDVVSPAVMDELYRFDLQGYVNDELPICSTDDDMAVCCASHLMCKSSLDSPPLSPVPSSPPQPRPPTVARPAFILVPHLGVHVVPADHPLPSAASICRLSPLDVQLRFSMTPEQLRNRAANLGCPLQSTHSTVCGKRDMFGTDGTMLIQYDKHCAVDSIQFAHPAHVSLVSQLDHTPGCLLDDLLSLSVQSFYSNIKQLVESCRCQLRAPQLTVLLTGEMTVGSWSFFARDELLGDPSAVGHGVAVVGISNTQQRRTILPRPPVPKFGATDKEKRATTMQVVKKLGKRKGDTVVTADELIRQRTRVRDGGGGSVVVQGKETQLCPLRFLLAACEVSNKWLKRDSDG